MHVTCPPLAVVVVDVAAVLLVQRPRQVVAALVPAIAPRVAWRPLALHVTSTQL